MSFIYVFTIVLPSWTIWIMCMTSHFLNIFLKPVIVIGTQWITFFCSEASFLHWYLSHCHLDPVISISVIHFECIHTFSFLLLKYTEHEAFTFLLFYFLFHFPAFCFIKNFWEKKNWDKYLSNVPWLIFILWYTSW